MRFAEALRIQHRPLEGNHAEVDRVHQKKYEPMTMRASTAPRVDTA